MTILLDGKKARDTIAQKLAAKIQTFKRKPKLVIIQLGNNAESSAYIRQKKLLGEKIGAVVEHVELDASISEADLISKINTYNNLDSVDGIILQLPIPDHLDSDRIGEAIHPSKDVDGLHSKNIKSLWGKAKFGFVGATAKGVLSLLDFYGIEISGKKAVIVGRSALVGKPLALAFLKRNSTVTICHRFTEDLAKITATADILIVAAGKPGLIGKENVSSGQVVVDVGINLVSGEKLPDEVPHRKLVGDVLFEEVKERVRAISPVPGGVGPMTVAALFENLVEAYERAIIN